MAKLKNYSFFFGKRINVDGIIDTDDIRISRVKKNIKFDGGRPTNEIDSCSYECMIPPYFDKFTVKIDGQTEPIISEEELAAIVSTTGAPRITFEDLTVMIFYNSESNAISDSFKATDAEIIG